MKRTTAVLMCVIVILSLFPNIAYGASDETYKIKSAGDLLKLAEKCTLDSYSENLTVELENDIDLSKTEFTSIPYFSGIFNGNVHTIKNYKVTSDGSHQGFFRYVSDTAFVSDLNVEGSLTPGGSGCTVGGIASENNGIISNCSFSGKISGVQCVGGIVSHSEGVIEKCSNNGAVVYERTGYNVGGIAGRESGYVNDCENNSAVLGRKDVGGIVGQLEPYTAWDFSESKLTDLGKELEELSKRVEKISSDADSSSQNSEQELSNSLDNVQFYIQKTSDDTKSLVNQTKDNIGKIGETAEDITELISDSISKHQHERQRNLLLSLKIGYKMTVRECFCICWSRLSMKRKRILKMNISIPTLTL